MKLNVLNLSMKALNIERDNINSSIGIINNDIVKYNDNIKNLNDININISGVKHKLLIYEKYIELFKKTNLPFKLMNMKLSSLDDHVNVIFSKYTNYMFHLDQSDSGRLVLDITDKNSGCVIDVDRLSGYESIILTIAINQAFLNVTDTFKCRLMIIDESLDCIDQTKFIEQLPEIINTIRNYYQTIIFISHRDVPLNMIDRLSFMYIFIYQS